MTRTAILLMGPTASGKTEIAISLRERFPCDIISVDSAMVYRGMDIGTAKPDRETLAHAPHRLIDICDPEDSYSAGQFVRDALDEMETSFSQGRIPLLVGGTMLYFRALTEGIADMPTGNDAIRDEIDMLAERHGWPAVHDQLQVVDPVAAARINPNDSQRIQRALEVYRVSGKALTVWQQETRATTGDVSYVKIALQVEPRKRLHERIEARLYRMVEQGLVEELRGLRARPGVTQGSPSMRSVGYRQFWDYLDARCTLEEASQKALFATRQLAKRQLTWLRSEKSVFFVNMLEAEPIDAISVHLAEKLR